MKIFSNRPSERTSHYVVTLWTVSGYFTFRTWSFYGQYVVSLRPVRCHFTFTTWSLSGHFAVTTRPLYGSCVFRISLEGHNVILAMIIISQKVKFPECSSSVPDDYNRVVLDSIPGEPDSDYVNASYVDVSRYRQACMSRLHKF